MCDNEITASKKTQLNPNFSKTGFFEFPDRSNFRDFKLYSFFLLFLTEYLNFFIKQGSDSSKLKMLAKAMLAKTRDELLTQNKKKKKTKRKDNNGYNLASSTETFTSNTSSKI